VRLALRRGEPGIELRIHPRLRSHFDYLVDHTRDLRVAVDRVIRRYGKEVVERQFEVARVADMAIELYVRSAVLSRTQALLEAHDLGEGVSAAMAGTGLPLGEERLGRVLRLCDLACQRSGLRFRDARDSLNDARDERVKEVARDVIAAGGRIASDPGRQG
jgi:hypothetical protein